MLDLALAVLCSCAAVGFYPGGQPSLWSIRLILAESCVLHFLVIIFRITAQQKYNEKKMVTPKSKKAAVYYARKKEVNIHV